MQQLVSVAEEAKFKLEIDEKEFDEIVKMETERLNGRTTLDERD